MDQTTDQKQKVEIKEMVAIPEINAIIQQVNPDKEIEFAKNCATALIKVIEAKPKKVIINNEQYLEFGDWQTIARFYRTTVGVDSVKEIVKDNNVIGYEAKAVVYFNAQIISGAIASCTREEENWSLHPKKGSPKPMFQLKSMAQTRACAKGLRNVFGWVVELAGYKSTPAEEVDTVESFSNNAVNDKPASPKQIKLIYDLIKQKANGEAKDKEQAFFWLQTVMDKPEPFDVKTMTTTDAKEIIEFLMDYKST